MSASVDGRSLETEVKQIAIVSSSLVPHIEPEIPVTGNLNPKDTDAIHALPTAPDPLSKNSQKKLLKRERKAEKKAEKKRAKKNAKKRAREEQPERLEATDNASTSKDDNCTENSVSKKRRFTRSPTKFNATVIIDLAFDRLMLEKEIASLCNQLAYVYASNRRAENPFMQVVCTRLHGRTEDKLKCTADGAHTRWRDIYWFDEGYEEIWELNSKKTGDTPEIKLPLPLLKENMVYLTADSTEMLSELKEGEIYILGGICDHNRYKNLCQDKAASHGIRTASLPIGKYIAEMQTRRVLTINQVFDIMCAWNVHKDWSRAFQTVVPKRKLKGKAGTDEL